MELKNKLKELRVTHSMTQEAVADHLEPVRSEFARLIQDKTYLKECYTAGAEKALRYSQRTINKVYRKIGFVDKG